MAKAAEADVPALAPQSDETNSSEEIKKAVKSATADRNEDKGEDEAESPEGGG